MKLWYPYRPGKRHIALQAYKHCCWPFLWKSFPQKPFQGLFCCCLSWLVTHQEISEGWQTAPLPLHVPVPPGFPLEEGYLSCAECHSTLCLYLDPGAEQQIDDISSKWTLPLPELNTVAKPVTAWMVPESHSVNPPDAEASLQPQTCSTMKTDFVLFHPTHSTYRRSWLGTTVWSTVTTAASLTKRNERRGYQLGDSEACWPEGSLIDPQQDRPPHQWSPHQEALVTRHTEGTNPTDLTLSTWEVSFLDSSQSDHVSA